MAKSNVKRANERERERREVRKPRLEARGDSLEVINPRLEPRREVSVRPRNLSLASSVETRKTRLDPGGVRVGSTKPRLEASGVRRRISEPPKS